MLPRLTAITFYDVAFLSAVGIAWPELKEAFDRVDAAERAREKREEQGKGLVLDPGFHRPTRHLE